MHFVVLEDRILPREKALIPAFDRASRFGDGVFTTIAVHNGTPYQWDWHMARLGEAASALSLVVEIHKILPLARELLMRNGVTEGLLRIALSRAGESRGYLPAEPAIPALLTMETRPFPAIPAFPVALWHSAYEKISPRALPVQFKLMQGMNPMLARMEAERQGCFEALQCGPGDVIAEASAASLFWYKNNRMRTAALSTGAYGGSTRAALLRLSGPETEQGEWLLSELKEADGVVLASTSYGVLPVQALIPEGWRWRGSETLADRLNALLRADREKVNFSL